VPNQMQKLDALLKEDKFTSSGKTEPWLSLDPGRCSLRTTIGATSGGTHWADDQSEQCKFNGVGRVLDIISTLLTGPEIPFVRSVRRFGDS